LRIFPLGGAYSIDEVRGSSNWWLSVLKYGALPAFTITLSSVGEWMLMMRNNMINVLAEDYITLAMAKGLPMRRIKYMYAARNAVLPSVTGFAMQFGFIVGGGLITEWYLHILEWDICSTKRSTPKTIPLCRPSS